ncbi:MAG: hypothetical protein F6K31_38360 [Symploca sp. SIO2G7]|nr:hypothetical protein [Symploca sp. SIO2G7]
MERPKEKRKTVIPFPGASPTPPTPHLERPRVPASGASVDNDTFTLTCHQCLIPNT